MIDRIQQKPIFKLYFAAKCHCLLLLLLLTLLGSHLSASYILPLYVIRTRATEAFLVVRIE